MDESADGHVQFIPETSLTQYDRRRILLGDSAILPGLGPIAEGFRWGSK